VSLYNDILAHLFDPASVAGAFFYAALVVVAGWILGKILSLTVHRYLNKADAAGMDSTSVRFLAQLAKVAVYLMALLVYVMVIPSLQSLGTAWLASVGVVSLVIGLATQTTLSNLVSGIALILYRPFRIGDRIQVATPAGPEIGVVESIDLGYTSLRTPDGRRVVIPNSIVTSQTNLNFSRSNSHVLIEISVTVTPESNTEDARNILIAAAKGIQKITKVNGCFITNLTAQGAVVMLSAFCLDPGDVAGIKSDLLENAQKQFAAKGIQLA
jgi:small-conductance mechanosensitive channel